MTELHPVVTPSAEATPLPFLATVHRLLIPASRTGGMLSMLDAGTTRIVVDLSRTQFLDSAAMAMLVSLMKRARQAGGDVRVVEPADESVRRILRLTRLDLVLNLRPSCDAALQGL